MALQYSHYFTTGPDGANIADAHVSPALVVGTGAPETLTYVASGAIQGDFSARCNVSATFRNVSYTLSTASQAVWITKSFIMPDLPAAQTYIMNAGQGGTRVSDVGISTSGTIVMRNISNAIGGASPVIEPGTLVHVAHRSEAGATGLRLKVYTGTTPTLIHDTGLQTSTATAGNLTIVRWGTTIASTINYVFDALQVDDSTEPTPYTTATPTAKAGSDTIANSLTESRAIAVSLTRSDPLAVSFTESGVIPPQGNVAPTVNAIANQTVEPFTTTTIAATATDTDGTIASWTFRQISGETVTLSGTGGTRTFATPFLRSSQDLVFGVRATDNGGAQSPEVTTTITVLPQNEWHPRGGVEVPMNVQSVHAT